MNPRDLAEAIREAGNIRFDVQDVSDVLYEARGENILTEEQSAQLAGLFVAHAMLSA